ALLVTAEAPAITLRRFSRRATPAVAAAAAALARRRILLEFSENCLGHDAPRVHRAAQNRHVVDGDHHAIAERDRVARTRTDDADLVVAHFVAVGTHRFETHEHVDEGRIERDI